MAGHSKWAQIKRQKAITDAKKGATYGKYSRALTSIARQGGADPDGNFRLRSMILQAKSEGVPAEVIDRALKKASEQGGPADEELRYEAIGPHGSQLLIAVQTDNRNRTVAILRELLSRAGGNLAANGAVSWNFELIGELVLQLKPEELSTVTEELMLVAGIDDLLPDEETGELTIHCALSALEALAGQLNDRYQLTTARPSYRPLGTGEFSEQQLLDIATLVGRLNAEDDIQELWTNV